MIAAVGKYVQYFGCAILIGTIFLPVKNLSAQTVSRDTSEDLHVIELSLKGARSKAGQLEIEFESAAKEQAKLNQKLIETAARVQAREQQITSGEVRLSKLAYKDADLRQLLKHRRDAMTEMLIALQKLDHKPPPMLAVSPNDAVAAIRSAMLLSSVVPQIRTEADSLSHTLRKLNTLREDVVEEQRQLALNQTQMEREHDVIERLLKIKNQLISRTAKERDLAYQHAEALAAEANSLRDLLTSLETDRRLKEEREHARLAMITPDSQYPETSQNPISPPPTAEEQRAVMMRPDSFKPAVKFASARGTLSLPATGVILREFGQNDGYGGNAKGISIETRPTAQVIAPNGGWVVYAGEFRGYGKLLIIDGDDGYHILLAGMNRIDVFLGQFVLAGEPLGQMGLQASESAAIGVTANQTNPVLYVEFRKNGNSVDPRPWWATGKTKARG